VSTQALQSCNEQQPCGVHTPASATSTQSSGERCSHCARVSCRKPAKVPGSGNAYKATVDNRSSGHMLRQTSAAAQPTLLAACLQVRWQQHGDGALDVLHRSVVPGSCHTKGRVLPCRVECALRLCCAAQPRSTVRPRTALPHAAAAGLRACDTGEARHERRKSARHN
jgi:hypothetical protein